MAGLDAEFAAFEESFMRLRASIHFLRSIRSYGKFALNIQRRLAALTLGFAVLVGVAGVSCANQRAIKIFAPRASLSPGYHLPPPTPFPVHPAPAPKANGPPPA